MFYLTKFCRICINTDGKLLDIYSNDSEQVSLSEKLRICTKMVISKEDLSTLICVSCVEKLQVSYKFQEMCMKSDGILETYLCKLFSEVDEKENTQVIKSELTVTISPISQDVVDKELSTINTINARRLKRLNHAKYKKYSQSGFQIKAPMLRFNDKKKRVSKGQRCSLLKKLLSNLNNNRVPHRKIKPHHHSRKSHQRKPPGGLKDLLVFIKGYDFGYKLENVADGIHENTPLDKLETFSKTFFYTDFTDYRQTILSVIKENHLSEDDDMFNSFDEDEDRALWTDTQQVNNIRIKEERTSDDEACSSQEYEGAFIDTSVNIKTEVCEDMDFLPSNLVQTCYDVNVKTEVSTEKEYIDFESYLKNHNSTATHPNQCSSTNNMFLNAVNSHNSVPTAPSSLELLQEFANRTKKYKKIISPNSLKCRTRGQPFINPQLMEQFKKRSFKCDICSRCFKTPGYLHSHCTKMGH